MTASEGPKIFRGTDLNSTLVVTLSSKPQRRPTIINVFTVNNTTIRYIDFVDSTIVGTREVTISFFLGRSTLESLYHKSIFVMSKIQAVKSIQLSRAT